jgi:hypothetical protein
MGVKLQSALGGSVELNAPSTASNFTMTVPAGNGTVATTDQLAGFRNRIINGAMDIWQRGTTFAAIGTGVYTVDRWQSTIAGSSLSPTASRSTSVPSPDFTYSLQYQQISSTASATEYAARQRFELSNVRDLAGKIVTISFWYRSNIVGTHGVRIIPTGSTGGVDTKVAITVNSANTWEYKTVTTTAFSAVTSWGSTAENATALILDIGLRVSDVGQTTIAANTYFNLTGVQLEQGSVATSFERRPYGTELSLCERYFEILHPAIAMLPWGSGSQIIRVPVTFRQVKRTAPSISMGTKGGGTGTMGAANAFTSGAVYFGSGDFQDVIEYSFPTAAAEL